MTPTQWSYLVFGIVLAVALLFDLGLLSKKNKSVTLKQALIQTVFWVTLGLLYAIFVWFEDGAGLTLEYLSAYFMEWGLSLDNIFVFIIIFSFFKVQDAYANRLLLYAILMAIVLRIVFITIGIALIDQFSWILYVFAAILLITGIKMLIADTDSEFDADSNFVYRILRKILPLTSEREGGKLVIKRNGKHYYTPLFVALMVLAGSDIIFAMDSIPAVFTITQHKMVIYTSNIFAVLGLRSLFFLLKGAVDKFKYLHQGIAFVLLFISIKMLITFFHIEIPILASLFVIVFFIGGAILYSLYDLKRSKNGN